MSNRLAESEDKVLAVVLGFAKSGVFPVTLSDIVSRCGLSESTVRRYLRRLQRNDLVVGGRRFRLHVSLTGKKGQQSFEFELWRVRRAAQPEIDELNEVFNTFYTRDEVLIMDNTHFRYIPSENDANDTRSQDSDLSL